MLRHIHVETTLFAPSDDIERARIDLMWWLEALTIRNEDYLKQRPETPRLYKSGVKWSIPKQLAGTDIDEIRVLKAALGSSANRRDVRKVLDKIDQVLGGEHFCDIGVILELGEIDCDGLAAYRTAELRNKGIPARVYLTHRANPGGGTTYHALVWWPPLGPECPYPTLEDPSLLLGMHQPERKAARDLEIQNNIERSQIIRRLTAGRPLPQPAFNDDELVGRIVADLDRIYRRAA